ncbi:MAG: hypothetical protein NDI94_04770 [Candidatus Woesearchaeota archaeon]|nr:hypothetical protein [Candidatus Woesearchaeota archaeon]
MESRKIQKSGTTYYLYLPASWCREHKITTNSVVYLDKSSKGDLVVEPKKTETNLSSLTIDLEDTSPEVINKMIIASYINPVKEFKISLKDGLSPDQILEHKTLLGGLELVDFDEKTITCQTALALSDPDVLLQGMIKKIMNIISLMKRDNSHDLIARYEQEVDKTNLLIQKSIISSLMYRKESKLRHVELYYIGMISRSLESIADILITMKDPKLVSTTEKMMVILQTCFEYMSQDNVVKLIKSVEKLSNVEVKNLETYKEKRVYQHFGHIGETLTDWHISRTVDK